MVGSGFPVVSVVGSDVFSVSGILVFYSDLKLAVGRTDKYSMMKLISFVRRDCRSSSKPSTRDSNVLMHVSC